MFQYLLPRKVVLYKLDKVTSQIATLYTTEPQNEQSPSILRLICISMNPYFCAYPEIRQMSLADVRRRLLKLRVRQLRYNRMLASLYI